MAQALQRFLDAHTAAEEARGALTRAQASGPDPLPAGVEFLFEAANSAWRELLALAGEDRHLAESEVESELGGVSAREYVGRRRSSGHSVEPQFSDWRDSIGAVDWSRSGRDAA
jgi:hypothetical protein